MHLNSNAKYKKGTHLNILSIQAPSLEANWRNEFLVPDASILQWLPDGLGFRPQVHPLVVQGPACFSVQNEWGHTCVPPDPRHSRGCRGGSTWGTCAFQAHSMMTYPQTVTPAQATAWEPLLQCCSACVWTPLSSSDKHKETARLHITGCTGT